MRTLKDYLVLFGKGFGMGSADVVPGVSGGTIAFISGIYEELVGSIKAIDVEAVRALFQKGPAAAWKKINGNFLVAIFAGVVVSVFSLAKALSYLLEHYPVVLWAFFFGLIVASAVLVGKKIKNWTLVNVLSLIAGGAIAYGVTVLTKIDTPHEWWFVFFAGVIAICAMILPGISGSFLLVVMGQYEFILGAVKELNLKIVFSFSAGALIGLLSFSRVIAWLFHKYHDATIAVLTGFMIGSLNKVWPWKNTLTVYPDSHGNFKPLLQENVLPGTYTEVITTVESQFLHLVEKPPFLMPAIGLAIAAFVIVWVLDRLGTQAAR